jgi:hypothetical protein
MYQYKFSWYRTGTVFGAFRIWHKRVYYCIFCKKHFWHYSILLLAITSILATLLCFYDNLYQFLRSLEKGSSVVYLLPDLKAFYPWPLPHPPSRSQSPLPSLFASCNIHINAKCSTKSRAGMVCGIVQHSTVKKKQCQNKTKKPFGWDVRYCNCHGTFFRR